MIADWWGSIIATIVAVALGTAIGGFLLRALWFWYGHLELCERARVTPPVAIQVKDGFEFHNYIKVAVRNSSEFKVFRRCKAVLMLEGKGRANYIDGNPFYEVHVEGELCWSGSKFSRDIYPHEEAYVDLFCIARKADAPSDLGRAYLYIPSKEGSLTFVVKQNGRPLEPKSRITCKLFLSLNWEGKLRIIPINGRRVAAELTISEIKQALAEHMMSKEFKILKV
ncbi:MAG: hypothetical protein ACXQTI_00695 [Candidatus Nezhaarchaeales archaeon]